MAYRKCNDWASQLPSIWNFLQKDNIKNEESSCETTWHVLAAQTKDKQLSLSGDFKSIEKDIYAALKPWIGMPLKVRLPWYSVIKNSSSLAYPH